jgi:hypothetical protein
MSHLQQLQHQQRQLKQVQRFYRIHPLNQNLREMDIVRLLKGKIPSMVQILNILSMFYSNL